MTEPQGMHSPLCSGPNLRREVVTRCLTCKEIVDPDGAVPPAAAAPAWLTAWINKTVPMAKELEPDAGGPGYRKYFLPMTDVQLYELAALLRGGADETRLVRDTGSNELAKWLGGEPLERCGAMRVATRETCALQNDHDGDHWFAGEHGNRARLVREAFDRFIKFACDHGAYVVGYPVGGATLGMLVSDFLRAERAAGTEGR